MDKGETVEMVMVEVQAREVTTQVEAVVRTGKVAVIPMVVEVIMVVEAATPLTKFGSPFRVRM